ncbi:MAG: transcriptional regulator [Mycobacterium sp.]
MPHNIQRERILRSVREHEHAVDAVEIASEFGLHVTTVRFHLNTLCDAGAVVRTRLKGPGPGRPRTGYEPAEERLDYQTLAEVLAMELGSSAQTRARRARNAGRRWAARMSRGASTDLADTTSDHPLDRAVGRATVAFAKMGFAPEIATATNPPMPSSASSEPTTARERLIRLHACPVRDFARSHPEVVCEIHLGLLAGLLADPASQGGQLESRHPAISGRLEPFVGPELCLARMQEETSDDQTGQGAGAPDL